MSKYISIPVLTAVYLYALPTLANYGYNSYYHIPYDYIDVSLKENIILFFQLFQAAKTIAAGLNWWIWLTFIIIFLALIFYYSSSYIGSKIITGLAVILAFLLLPASYKFGGFVAANTSVYWVLSSECHSFDNADSYIIPRIYNGTAVMVPIDADTKKIKDAFITKNVSELGCTLEHRDIGKFKQ
jgi:hypothetical protein